MSKLQRTLYTSLAGVSFGLGVVGVFLPLMPTTVFMLLALWLASRGSPRFAGWIRRHPRFGPPIVAWEGERAIPRHAKYLACAMLAVSMIVIVVSVDSRLLQGLLIPGLALLGVWIAMRAEPTDTSAPSRERLSSQRSER